MIMAVLAETLGGSEESICNEVCMRLISDEALAVVTIYQEAQGEPYEGKLAVAEVIRNRMQKKYASDGSVSGTVLKAKQFSGWNSVDPGRVRAAKIDSDDPIVKECIRAWHEASAGSNTVHGSVLYLNPKDIEQLGWTYPEWALPDSATEVARVGNHVFFIPRTK